MNPDQFKKHLNAVQIQIKTFAKKDAPRIAGKVAIDHFKENFQNEAFEKKKWKEVKRRKSKYTKGAKKIRKILTGDTGDLGRSIENAKYSNNTATITSDLPYSAVHNEGLRAGRGRGFRMPKRQFMAHSSKLAEKTEKEIIKKLDNIIHKTK